MVHRPMLIDTGNLQLPLQNTLMLVIAVAQIKLRKTLEYHEITPHWRFIKLLQSLDLS